MTNKIAELTARIDSGESDFQIYAYEAQLEVGEDDVVGSLNSAIAAAHEAVALIPNWTRVEDGLPEETGRYLVTIGKICPVGVIMRYSNNNKKWCDQTVSQCDITAWMPLPEPYQEEQSHGDKG